MTQFKILKVYLFRIYLTFCQNTLHKYAINVEFIVIMVVMNFSNCKCTCYLLYYISQHNVVYLPDESQRLEIHIIKILKGCTH